MKWLLLDDSINENHICMTIQQICDELVRQKDEVSVVNTFADGRAVSSAELKKVLYSDRYDIVLFQGPTGLRYLNILGGYPGTCVNLWFDDPLMRVAAYGLDQQMKDSAMLYEHFIWDGYWRQKVKDMWGLDSLPIHLAASGDQFYETATVFNEDDIIFLGNLHSPRSIELMCETLPPTFQRIVRFAQNYIRELPEECEVPSWDQILKMAYEDSLPGEKRLIQIQNSRGHDLRANLQWCIWAMSKNHVRVRMLKRALKVGSVRMFADTIQHSHASESETRGLVGEWSSRLNFHATDGLSADQLAELYHHGWIQIQATDPQSVAGGIPYRVFQTAASGRALLTDKKPELADAFEYGKEILVYENMVDFENKLFELSKNKSSLREVGRAARARFEKEHTWKHRIDYMKSKFFFSPPSWSRKVPESIIPSFANL